MKNLIQDTVEKIKKHHITPEPRWKYLMKKYSLWIIFLIILILAAVSFSVAYDNINNLDWDLYRFMHQSQFSYFLSLIPYFWVVIIVIFLVAAFFGIRRTETGYRYNWAKIFAITTSAIFIFGLSITLLGLGNKLNAALMKDIPFYSRHIMVTKESQWTEPEKGFLAGTILSASENKLEINDLNGKDWNIQIDEKTSIRSSVNLSQEEIIKIIGTKQDENNFKAEEIRPWIGKGMGNGANAGNGERMNGFGPKGGMMRGK